MTTTQERRDAEEATIVKATQIREKRLRLINAGQDMTYIDAVAYLIDALEIRPTRLAYATVRLADVLGERIVWVDAIRSPLVLVCDDPHTTNDYRSGRYHIGI